MGPFERHAHPQVSGFAWLSTHHYTPRQRLAIDLVTVAVLAVLTGMVISGTPPRVHGEVWTVLGWASVIGTSLLFLVRRRHPWAVLTIVTLAAAVGLAVRGSGPAFFYMVLVLYVVVARSGRRTGTYAALIVAALDLPASILNGGTSQQPAVSIVIGSLALIALAWLAGDNTRQASLSAQRRREQAAAEAAAAEAERDERTRRKIAEERALIARELHDIVAHTMSVIAVRAGVGRMVLASQPQEAEEALQIIETTARSSLAEMRLMVQILRSPQGVKPDLGPLPGLGDLEQLLAQVQTAGVDVTLQVTGRQRPLSPLAELTAYRIVQEALTNTVRHAGPTGAQVRVDYLADQLEIEVRDEGPRDGRSAVMSPDGEGHGIVGMRERAAVFGASLEAGPDRGGFRIRTRLNVDAAPALGAQVPMEAAHG